MSATSSWDVIKGSDLGIYRVVFAVLLLLQLPTFTWLSAYPDALYRPPPGPMRLVSGFPPEWFFAGLEVGVAVSLACLFAGVAVRCASWAATLLMLVGYGFAYSLGKIDHTILMALTPAVMGVAGWAPGARVRPWVMQLWAFTIGVAMLTAGLPKIASGWLDPSTHAVRDLVAAQVYAHDQGGWPAHLAAGVTWLPGWEIVDWSAPVLECSLIVLTLLGLRWFRGGLALMTLFHAGVALTTGIAFAPNVLSYGPFAPWTAWCARLDLRVVRSTGRRRVLPARLVPAVAAGGLLVAHATPVGGWVQSAVVYVGALVTLVALAGSVSAGRGHTSAAWAATRVPDRAAR